MRSPILFVVFNRPDTTRRVFDAIRTARPPILYVAADGPRQGVPGEALACTQVREVATGVDWDCEVKTRFCESNHGCRGVARAIDWFFEQEEEGIIIEDDVVPVSGFFEYCDELLNRYRDDTRVGLVLGSNFIESRHKSVDSYFFSGYSHIWGWATWRRVWKLYDGRMSEWPDWRDDGSISKAFRTSRKEEEYWCRIFQSVYENKIDTWAYQLMFMCWKNNFLTANPSHNLIQNIGFGVDATHTLGEVPEYVRDSPPRPMKFPLTHPSTVQRDVKADKEIWRRVFDRTFTVKLKRLLARSRKIIK